MFLFGLLPLVFIPCLFVPSSLDVIRYAFLGLCVLGLGGMWYRQMFSSVTRLIVSMVYVALCIVTVAMMMQGGRDVLRTGANSGQPASVQSSVAPDGNDAAAAVPSETPSPTPVPTPSGPSEAEQRLETFMALWQNNNPQEMVSLVQPSWASAQENPSTALFVLLANRTPEDYTIEEISGTDPGQQPHRDHDRHHQQEQWQGPLPLPLHGHHDQGRRRMVRGPQLAGHQ